MSHLTDPPGPPDPIRLASGPDSGLERTFYRTSARVLHRGSDSGKIYRRVDRTGVWIV